MKTNFYTFINEYREFDYKNNATLLRKLSLKSRLRFGKFKLSDEQIRMGVKDEPTIEEILEKDNNNYKSYVPMLLRNNRKYLRWVYFNTSNITFMDDILDEIGISMEFRIKKPGKDPILFQKLNNKLFEELVPYDVKQKFLKRKDKYKELEMDDDDEILAKNILQSINQGKSNWTIDNKHHVKNVYKRHKETSKEEDIPQKTLVKDWVKNKNISLTLCYLLINNFKYVEDINYYKLSKLTYNDKRYWNEFVKVKNT